MPPKPKRTARPASPRYKLETVARACAILREFSDEREALTLTEVIQRTGFERTICFRLLHTLEGEGFLRKLEGLKYASNLRLRTGKRFRIGYASQGHDSFSSALSQGLHWAATERQIDLVEFDNQYSAKAAVRNAELLIKQRVDLAIEFQVYDRLGPRLSGLFAEAGIPVIAIEIPQPGATFFGVDNHRVGVIAGTALLKAAQKKWQGEVAEILLLDLGIAGSLPSLRLSGALSVLRKGLEVNDHVTHLESRGEFIRSFELTRKHLQFTSKRRTLLTGVNDAAVLGALRAFEEAGRSDMCIAVGLGGTPEARKELRLPNARLAATVAFFPERYGDSLLLLALDILQRKNVPPSIYVPVQLLTAQNVDQFYPKDIFALTDLTP